MAKSSSAFVRRAARFRPQPRVLVLCEDSKSSLQYLSDASRHFRSYALVEFAHCGRTDPIGIVEEGIRRSRHFESVFCVIDEDAHESFQAALGMAGDAGGAVTIIASYPCYEYWLLLHFRFSRAPVRGVGIQSAGARIVAELRREEGMHRYDKGASDGLFERLLSRLPAAQVNAERALVAAHAEGAMNPSTTMHLLLCRLKELGQLEKLPEPS
jgi:hypothetical protein